MSENPPPPTPPDSDPLEGQPDTVAAAFFDPITGALVALPHDGLLREIRTESPKRAIEFDQKFGADAAAISREWAVTSGVVTLGVRHSSLEPVNLESQRVGIILFNALQTVAAALEVLRSGYALQPGILLRSSVEAVAMAFDLSANSKSMDRFKRGTYRSSGAVGRAKRLFRVIEPVYGILSEQHTHIGDAHERAYSFEEHGRDATNQLVLVKAAMALLAVGAELIFSEVVSEPRFWRAHPAGGLTFKPDGDVLEYLSTFVELESVSPALSEPERTINLPKSTHASSPQEPT